MYTIERYISVIGIHLPPPGIISSASFLVVCSYMLAIHMQVLLVYIVLTYL